MSTEPETTEGTGPKDPDTPESPDTTRTPERGTAADDGPTDPEPAGGVGADITGGTGAEPTPDASAEPTGDASAQPAGDAAMMTFLNTYRKVGGAFEIDDEGIRFWHPGGQL
ncbi:hypothetical protein ACWDU8_34795, partial [Streptomyces sp. NPDC003388]